VKIGRQDLNLDARDQILDGPDGPRVMSGAFILKVIPRHGSNDDILQAELFGRERHTFRLVGAQYLSLAITRDGAKPAMPRTDLAENHEGGGVFREAFVTVRAHRGPADRIKLILFQDRMSADRGILRQGTPEPIRKPAVILRHELGSSRVDSDVKKRRKFNKL
jgi:hypothetical protein